MRAHLEIIDTSIAGLKVVQRNPMQDARGYFSRFFCTEEFRRAGLNDSIAQINQSYSQKAGTLRGMHYQSPPHAECKYVSCVRGEIFDVAVDLRRDSPTFLHWHGEVLSAQNQRSLFIPDGLAHGFQTLTDDCELLYLVSASYEPTAEGVVNAQDPMINIAWPRPVSEISDKDRAAPLLQETFAGIELDPST